MEQQGGLAAAATGVESWKAQGEGQEVLESTGSRTRHLRKHKEYDREA